MRLKIGFLVCLVLSFGLAVVSFHAPTKERIIDFLTSDQRTVLAKADADLTGQGFQVTVLKVKTGNTLAIEVFKNNSDGNQHEFLKRLVLDDTRDGYFTFRGNATNLVVTDIDVDGTLEIIAPTFDDNLVPRLNIYKFHADSLDFEKLGAGSISL